MLYPMALFAMFVILVGSCAQNVHAEAGQFALEQQSEEFQAPPPLLLPRPEKVRPIEVHASDASLDELAKWLSANFDLPYAARPPRIEHVTPLRLHQLRHRAFLSPSTPSNAGNATPPPGYEREVVAVYEDSTRTIYLQEGWTGATAAEQSVLVHEMVHHLQNMAGLKFGCVGEREKAAYFAQDKWLQLNGLELEKEFDVDLFTVIALSTCMG
jgi:hypothetical protein